VGDHGSPRRHRGGLLCHAVGGRRDDHLRAHPERHLPRVRRVVRLLTVARLGGGDGGVGGCLSVHVSLADVRLAGVTVVAVG
jgi:hypothetical protein